MKRPEYRDEYEKMLIEDIKVSLDKMKKIPKSDWNFENQDYALYRSIPQLYPARPLLARERLLDFENDPFAWDFLNFMDKPNDTFIATLLFPPDGSGEIDETMYRLFEKARKEDNLSRSINHVGAVLCRPGHYEKALPFLEGALRQNERDHSVESCLIQCSLGLGDWQKVETYTVEYFSQYQGSEQRLKSDLAQAAELADKAGETKEAERIRQRIANLRN